MPSKNTASPIKPAAPLQEPSSDHSIPRSQSPSTSVGLSHSHKLGGHKPHRPHVVVSHRGHVRNSSHKNLNKIQRRLSATHMLTAEGDPSVPSVVRQHQHKKSIPKSASASPRAGHHVRWNGSAVSLGGHTPNVSMKRNLSTPVLRQDGSGILVKRSLLLNKAAGVNKSGGKKSVGFQLAHSDEEGEWEDHSSHSPESTRRNSVVITKANAENSPVSTVPAKSPLVQMDMVPDTGGRTPSQTDRPSRIPAAPDYVGGAPPTGQQSRLSDQDDIASRVLQRRPSVKATPAISAVSSISATATPPTVDRSPRVSSFSNLSSNQGTQADAPPRSAPSLVKASNMGNNPHATSSSIEGGVSRFLTNNGNPHQVGAPSDSDPSTSSSFLPHYHPQTPPSPETTTSRKSKSPPSSRHRVVEPPSRTQQKLWLQRKATLTTSQPDSSTTGTSAAISPPAIELSFSAATHSKSGPGPYSHESRRGVRHSGPPGGSAADSEAKRVRKIYDRFASEFAVVRRFRRPAADSFSRLDALNRVDDGEGAAREHAKGQILVVSDPTNSNTSLGVRHPHHALVQQQARAILRGVSEETTLNREFVSKAPKLPGQVRFRDREDNAKAGESEEPVERLDVERQPRHAGAVAVVLADGNIYDEQIDDDAELHRGDGHSRDGATRHPHLPNEEEMLIRRMWNSREIADEGD